MCCRALACSHDLCRQSLALGADEQRDRTRESRQRLGGWARVGHERHPLARQLGDRLHTSDLHIEDRAHAGPHGLRRMRIGATRAERHAARAERLRRAQHRTDVPRVPDAMQVHAQRTTRRHGPALLVHTDHARSRTQCRHGDERVPLHIDEALSAEPAARHAIALERTPSCQLGRGDQVLALGREAAAELTIVLARQATQLLEGWIVLGGDSHRFVRFSSSGGPFVLRWVAIRYKKGRRPLQERRPRAFSVECLPKQPTPRGLARR